MLNNIGDDLKKIVLLGIGAAASAAEKCGDAKEIIEDLVKKGELTVEQGKVLNEELKHTVKEKLNEVADAKKEEHLQDQLTKMSKEERAALKAKLEAMDKEVSCDCEQCTES